MLYAVGTKRCLGHRTKKAIRIFSHFPTNNTELFMAIMEWHSCRNDFRTTDHYTFRAMNKLMDIILIDIKSIRPVQYIFWSRLSLDTNCTVTHMSTMQWTINIHIVGNQVIVNKHKANVIAVKPAYRDGLALCKWV